MAWRRLLRVVVWVPWIVSISGCVRYDPRPLSREMSSGILRTSLPSAEELREFASELETTHSLTEFDPGDGLSLPEAERVLLLCSLELREKRLRAEVVQAGAAQAGRWDDPELSGEALRILDRVESRWVLGSSLGFTVPVSGRLKAEKGKAGAEVRVAHREVFLAEQESVVELREAWAEWSASEESLKIARDFADDVGRIADIAERQWKAGELTGMEGRVFLLEAQSRKAELVALETSAEMGRLRVLGLLGLSPQAPYTLIPSLSSSSTTTDSLTLALAEEKNPRLLLRRVEYHVAEETLRLEIRKQYPDLELGPVYGHEDGSDRLGLGFSLPLPIWNRNARAIAEAEKAREAARAAYEAEVLRVATELAERQVRLQGAEKHRAALLDSLIPLAAQQIRDARALADLGELNVLLLLEALNTSFETRNRLVEAQKEVALASASYWALVPEIRRPSQSNKENSHD